MSVFQKRFLERDPNDPIFNQVFIIGFRERKRSGKNTSQENRPVQQPSEPKEINKDQATLQLKKFLQEAQKLKVPVNIQGREAYDDRTNQGVDDSFLPKPKK